MFNLRELFEKKSSSCSQDNSDIELLELEDNDSTVLTDSESFVGEAKLLDNNSQQILDEYSDKSEEEKLGQIVIDDVISSKILDEVLESKENTGVNVGIKSSRNEENFIMPFEEVIKDKEIEVGKKQKNIMRKSAELTKIELIDLIKRILDISKFDMETKILTSKFSEKYINYKYFFEGDFNCYSTKSDLQQVIKRELESFANELIELKKYSTKTINKVKNAFLIVNNLNFQDINVDDILNNNNLSLEQVSEIKKIIANYNRYYNNFLKKLDNKVFSLVLIRYGLTNIYVSNVKAKIKFSSIFSKEGIDKAFHAPLVVEDMKSVQLKLLSIKIFEDWLNFSLKEKYLIYLPKSLYKKSRKIYTVLGSIDDSYSQHKILIIVDCDILKNYEKVIKHLKKTGYHFVLDISLEEFIKNKNVIKQLYLLDSMYLYDTEKEIGFDKLKGINFDEKKVIYGDNSLLELEGGVIL